MTGTADRTAVPGAVRGRPRHAPVWRLPPWSRAPWLGLRSPAAVVAVLVTTAILACAGASAPLFLSSSRSAALQQELAPQCAEAGWPSTGALVAPYEGTTPAQLATYADRFPAAWRGLGHPSDQVLVISQSVGRSGNPQQGIPVDDPAGSPLSQTASMLRTRSPKWSSPTKLPSGFVDSSAPSGTWARKTMTPPRFMSVRSMPFDITDLMILAPNMR